MLTVSLAKPVELFAADRGYPNFRIPSLLAMNDGTLALLWEIREGRSIVFSLFRLSPA